MTREERYRRLLRWYPKAWRERSGEVLVGTMLDEADRLGQDGPSAAQRRSAALHGLGQCLDARLALAVALAALAAAAAAGVISMWFTGPLAAVGAPWALPALSVVVSPALVMVGFVALARSRGPLSDPRAVALVPVTLCAFVLGGLAFAGWSDAFDAADRDVRATGIGAVWPWLLAAAWLLGGSAVALLIQSLLRRAVLTVLLGVVLPPAMGALSISPYVPGVVAVLLAVLTIGVRRPVRSVPQPAVRPGPASSRSRRLARMLAAGGAVASAAGIAHALLGGRWSEIDATAVIAQGITLSLVSALPLLGAVVILSRTANTRGPIILAALSLGAIAIAYTAAPDWNRMAPGLAAAAALGGAGVGLWTVTRLRGSARLRALLGVLIGIGYASFLGVLVAAMLAFAIPLLATAFAIWGASAGRGVRQVPHSDFSTG